MQFRSRKAAFIAMMLSEHAQAVFPDANQIFHRDGTLTVKGIRINLQRSGKIHVVDSPLIQAELRESVKLSQNPPEIRIRTSMDGFAESGNEWGNPNYEFSAQHVMTRHQPDGTHVSVDRNTIEGYEDHGPVARPAWKPDPAVDQNQVERGIQARQTVGARLSMRARHGLR